MNKGFSNLPGRIDAGVDMHYARFSNFGRMVLCAICLSLPVWCAIGYVIHLGVTR